VSTLDGDTVEVRTDAGRHEIVRLIGVDTPGTHHPDRPVECFGPEAAAHTEARLLGRRVSLRFDVERRDRYGRLLAYVDVDGTDVAGELLRLGYGHLLVIAPNSRNGRDYLAAELEARDAHRGLWAACP
jgi:micrococcal nuclease